MTISHLGSSPVTQSEHRRPPLRHQNVIRPTSIADRGGIICFFGERAVTIELDVDLYVILF